MQIATRAHSSTLEDDSKNRYILFAIAEGSPEGKLSQLLGSFSSIHDAMVAIPVTATKYCIFDRKDLKLVFTGYLTQITRQITH